VSCHPRFTISEPQNRNQAGQMALGLEELVTAKAFTIPGSSVSCVEDDRGESVVPIALASLTGALIFLIPPMYFTQIAADLDVTSSALGMTATVLLLAGTLTALITGPLADRHGTRPLLIAGSLAAGGYLLGFSVSPNLDFLLPAAVLGGVAHAILPNLSTAAAGSITIESARRRALGWTSASAALSVVIISPVLALIVSVAGWRAAFALAAMLSLGAGGLIRSRMRNAFSSTGSQGFIDGYATLLRHRQSRILLASSVLRAICWFGMLTYLGAFVGDRLNAAPLAIAAIFAAGGSTFFAGSLLTPRLMQRIPARTILKVTQLAMALFVAVLFLGSNSCATALIVTALLGLLGGFSFVAFAALLIEQTPVGRSTTVSLNAVLSSGAATIGGALGAAVLTVAGYSTLALLSVPAVISVLVLYWPLKQADHAHSEPGNAGMNAADVSFRRTHVSSTIEA
jgi:predicted MFS family arabinose efflux permease